VFVVEDRDTGVRRTARVNERLAPGGPGRQARVLTFSEEGFAPSRARLHLPAMQVDAEALTFQPIDFEYATSDWGVYSLNC